MSQILPKNTKSDDEIEVAAIKMSQILPKNTKSDDEIEVAAIWCDYSETFRAVKGNYCIASIDNLGHLDFEWTDSTIRHIPIPHNKEISKWVFDKNTDKVWAAYLLSQYMKETQCFKTVITTVAKMKKCSVWSL